MNDSTTRNVSAGIKTLRRDFHLFRDVTESRFGLMSERFDHFEQILSQHSSALTELAADMASRDAHSG